ncbi:unnamed protein product, partial [Sphacelaria rigidula]
EVRRKRGRDSDYPGLPGRQGSRAGHRRKPGLAPLRVLPYPVGRRLRPRLPGPRSSAAGSPARRVRGGGSLPPPPEQQQQRRQRRRFRWQLLVRHRKQRPVGAGFHEQQQLSPPLAVR